MYSIPSARTRAHKTARFLKILAYLGLAGVIFLALYYIAMGVLSLLGIVFIEYATRWAEYLSAGVFLLAFMGSMIGLFVFYPRTQRARARAQRYIVKLEEREKEETAAIDALCEHLKLLGVDATVESKGHKQFETSVEKNLAIVGSVRVANRSIDLIEWQLDVFDYWWGDYYKGRWDRYRCNYVLRLKVDGLEYQLKAKSEPVFVKKGFLKREFVGFKWAGNELAQVLNNDADITKMLYPLGKLNELRNVETIPYKEHQCVRMRQVWVDEWTNRPNQHLISAFPTIETFNAFDRIAQHILTIAKITRSAS